MITKQGIVSGIQFNESLSNINNYSKMKQAGSPTITNTIASNFSTSNYFWYGDSNSVVSQTEYLLRNVKIEYSVEVSSYADSRWFGNAFPSMMLTMGMNSSGKVLYGNLGQANLTSDYTMPLNKKVYFRIEPDSSTTYCIKCGTERGNWTTLVSGRSDQPSQKQPIYFGRGYSASFTGKMDLRDIVIWDLNANIIFTPSITETYQNVIKNGSAIITDDGILSNFSSTNYFHTPTFDLSGDIWEIRNLRVKTGTAGDSGVHPILSGRDDGKMIINLLTTSNYFTVGFSSTGTNWSIAGDVQMQTFTSNTWYSIDLTFDGTSYKAYINGTLTNTFNNTAKLYDAANTSLYLGIHRTKSSWFNGLIDISSLIVKNNDIVVYSSNKKKTCISDYQISAEDFYEI